MADFVFLPLMIYELTYSQKQYVQTVQNAQFEMEMVVGFNYFKNSAEYVMIIAS